MGKLKKIVEARSIVSTHGRSTAAGLEKLLSKKELAALEPELGLFRQACRMLENKLLSLEPGLSDKAANLPKS